MNDQDFKELRQWSSRYVGPIARSSFAFRGRSLVLNHPEDPDRLLDDPEVALRNHEDDYMPYWAFLWPGAFLLAETLAASAWTGRELALEIGCGVGLAGLSGLRSGIGKVVFTDYDEAPLSFIASSARANRISEDRFEVRRLDWRSLPDERYDLIFGADVLYEHRLLPLVANLLQRMLSPDGHALIAGPSREASQNLETTLSQFGLNSESRPIESVDERGEQVQGLVHRIWK